MSKPTLKITKDFTDDFNKVIKQLKYDKVLLGIPKGSSRKDDEINNAAILAINEFGSPQNNIPARHPMRTALGQSETQDLIAEEFKKAAVAALTSGTSSTEIYYERAGIIGSNAIKSVINNQIDMDPPSDETFTAREYQGFKGTKALIVTGQMRNSITSVVKRGL